MDARVIPKGSRPSSPRAPRGSLSRSFLASTTLHATVLGAGLLWGVWTVGGRPPARVYAATFAAPETLALATPERETLDPSEPEDPPEPVLRESEVWSEPPPTSEVLARPEPEPALRRVDWVAARPFAIGTLAPHEEPAPLVLPPVAASTLAPAAALTALVVSEPVPLEVPPPVYPRLARRAGEEGSVLCRLALDATGRVVRVEVVESSGFERLDEAARSALAAWRFVPRRENGVAVEACVLHRVTFRLGEG